MIHLGSEENHFIPPHPHFTVDFFPPSLPKPQFLLQLLSLINCQYVGQNYLNIIASFLIFSSLVISLSSLMMFSSKFSTSL